MKKILLISVLLSALSCSGQDGRLPDKKTMNVIKKAEKVCLYYVDPLTDDFSKGKIQGFALKDSVPIVLTQNNKDSLVALIQESVSNHQENEVVKMCMVIPGYALQFVRGNDTVSMFIDFQCNKAHYCFGARTYDEDIDDISGRLRKLVTDISADNHSAYTITKSAESIITEDIKEIVASADSLSWFIVDAMENPTDKGLNFNGFLILQQESETQTDSLAKFLISPTALVKTDFYNECVFLPDLCIRFYGKNNQKVDVMFSFYCNECRIICGETELSTDFAKIRRYVIGFAKDAFPNDKYLRVMYNK